MSGRGLDFLDAPVRQARTIDEVSHRPWALPDEAWFQGRTSHDVLFAHWRADAAELGRLLPPELTLDLFAGVAWIGVVALRVTGLRLRGLPPLPGLSSFAEVNVRTYVTHGGRPGVWLFSMTVPNAIVAEAVKRLYKLPAERGRVAIRREGKELHGVSLAHGDSFDARYRGRGKPAEPERGTLEHFLTERYCLYTADGGRLYRAEVHHRPWQLQRAEAAIESTSVAPVPLAGDPHLLYCARQDSVAWALEEA
jgi:uncharacterized protein YqjF (DUF2071 family)